MGAHSQADESRLPWLLLGLTSLGVAAVIAGIALPGWIRFTEFDERAVQQGVVQVLSDNGYPVGPVSCPAGQPVEVGHRFRCRASIGGAARDVTVTVRTAGGEYAVGAPH